MLNHNMKVAIVDDNSIVLKQFEVLMRRMPNTETFYFSSPNEFIFTLLSSPIDLAIIDINMPDLDGIQILTILANESFQAPILIHSAVDEDLLSDIQQFAISSNLKILGVLKKPTSFDELENSINKALHFKSHKIKSLKAENKLCCEVDLSEPNISQIFKAIEQKEFYLVIQPKIDLLTGKWSGGEFLTRWKGKDYSIESVIKKIEDSNLIDTFSMNVVNEAFDALKLNKEKVAELNFSINLSTKNLESDKLVLFIKDYAETSKINNSKIMIEMTETSFSNNDNLCLEKLLRLKLSGFQISLDDFGTGFSTFKQLQNLPFSEIKIDKLFIQNFNQKKSASIIESIVTLAHSLNLKTVAEGIETKQQESFCKQCGIQYGQGYLYSKPVSITDFFSALH